MTKQEIPDGWSPDGMTLILSGMGYRLKKDLTQVCIGPVDADGEPLEKEGELPKTEKEVATAPRTPSALIEQNAREFCTNSQVLEDSHRSFAPLKHPGGRPRKTGEVSRWTIQRREKEKGKQGVLL